jgi:hypothetical protein
MMRALRRLVAAITAGAVIIALGLILLAAIRTHPEDWPWTPLDLSRPIGAATGRKLAALGGAGPRCRSLLRQAGVRFAALAPVRDGQCGYDDAVRLSAGGSSPVAWRPGEVSTACPVAAALVLWEWNVLQPAAQARFGSHVAVIEHVGSYNCRRIVGGESGRWSEHAHANAIDITGFRLADGTRISVARDWRGTGGKAAFLRDVRDGACRLFATVLSPDYNAAHRDHLHLDQAARGAWGARACR